MGYPPPGAYPQQPGALSAADRDVRRAAGHPAGVHAAPDRADRRPSRRSGQMAVPGPVAFQCTNDVPCGTHHCNVQYGKCAFPCQTAADCISPNSCMMGLCVPQMPQAAPAH